MSHLPSLNLPPELQPFRAEIENTFLKYLQIKITPDLTTLWQSKFGGLPYLPKHISYPVNDQGEYLHLVAQLNFREIPSFP